MVALLTMFMTQLLLVGGAYVLALGAVSRLEQQQVQLAEQSRVTGLALCFLAAGVGPDDGPQAARLAELIRDTYAC
jgi:hypothetical protein